MDETALIREVSSTAGYPVSADSGLGGYLIGELIDDPPERVFRRLAFRAWPWLELPEITDPHERREYLDLTVPRWALFLLGIVPFARPGPFIGPSDQRLLAVDLHTAWRTGKSPVYLVTCPEDGTPPRVEGPVLDGPEDVSNVLDDLQSTQSAIDAALTPEDRERIAASLVRRWPGYAAAIKERLEPWLGSSFSTPPSAIVLERPLAVAHLASRVMWQHHPPPSADSLLRALEAHLQSDDVYPSLSWLADVMTGDASGVEDHSKRVDEATSPPLCHLLARQWANDAELRERFRPA